MMGSDSPVLMQGDCLELLEKIPDNSIDMVCCDLPYGTTNCRWDTTLDLRRLWEQYRRVTTESAAIVLFAQTPFDKVLGVSNLEWLRYELIWQKTRATGHLNCKKMPMKAHENILVFYNKLPTFNPQKTTGHPRKTGVKRRDDTPVYGVQNFIELSYDSTERYPRSVLTFPSDTQRVALHPTQKPLALIEWLVSTFTNEGDTVLDNCMGSGTTGEACRNLRRHFVGMESDASHFAVACTRIMQGDVRALRNAA
ncbi:site-specific DNA-methyltransferase [Burkholderia sp. Tr-20390]|uniref:DNA-methyltransferase n=1 Tax=Burkholderia sp. Tr-20390 TaxID=2703904 RepID=UPI00197CCC99|nr:site-specific DNA-methyltransferase [Burkholderia sp. Tr-20390]MBN3729510.1 site-specific DNA-methyltransferase [Burkholderia sp. Tr-20390]